MKHHSARILSLLLALVLCLGLLPGAALAEETEEEYDITFDASPGAFKDGTTTRTTRTTSGESDTTKHLATYPEEFPERSGYTFQGWVIGDGSSASNVNFTADATVTAKWAKVRTSKTTPALAAAPDRIETGTKKVELALSCTTGGVSLDWRPLERHVAPAGGSNLESAVGGLLTGNFSDVGLKLTKIFYEHTGADDVDDDAYPHEFYPEGVCPASALVLTLEGEAEAGTLTIQLAGENFLEVVPKGNGTVLDASSAQIFNAAQVKIPVGDPDGPYTVKFDLNYKDPPKAEIPKDQTVQKGSTVLLPDGAKLTCPFVSHEFYAWCVKGSDGKLYPWNESAAVTGDMTLYAGWVKKGTAVKKGEALPDSSSKPAEAPKPAQPSAPAKTAFADVAPTSPFAPAISWAVEKKITNGKTATSFGPGDPCTRAQIVTFLWRAAGSPEPKLTETQYMDVTDPGAYYYKAVQWAAEMDMEYAGTFDPHETCNRASAVYFIWKAFGSPKAAARSGFADMPEEPANGGQWYWPDLLDAVDWAVSQGVTTGKTVDTFAPADPCTRGQIVTFLYRAYEK